MTGRELFRSHPAPEAVMAYPVGVAPEALAMSLHRVRKILQKE
jgi:hypothetical protein